MGSRSKHTRSRGNGARHTPPAPTPPTLTAQAANAYAVAEAQKMAAAMPGCAVAVIVGGGGWEVYGSNLPPPALSLALRGLADRIDAQARGPAAPAQAPAKKA